MNPNTALCVEIVLKVSVVALLTLALLVAMRRCPAASRHFVCILGLVAILAIFPARLMLPTAKIALLPASRVASSAELDSAGSVAIWTEPHISAMTLPASPVKRWVDPLGVALIVWLVVAGLLVARVAIGMTRLYRRSHRAQATSDPRLDRLLGECRNTTGGTRPIRLLIEPSTGTSASPLTFGGLRPVLLLPAEASDWPDQRVRGAFLHELAHIRRNDWLSLLAMHAVTTVFWFHPLIWIIAKHAQSYSEQAADDLVIESGLPVFDYARQLVELAKSLRPASPETAALAMASSGKLEARLMRLMNHSYSQRQISGKTKGIALGLFAAFALSVSAMQLTERPGDRSSADPPTITAPGSPATSAVTTSSFNAESTKVHPSRSAMVRVVRRNVARALRAGGLDSRRTDYSGVTSAPKGSAGGVGINLIGSDRNLSSAMPRPAQSRSRAGSVPDTGMGTGSGTKGGVSVAPSGESGQAGQVEGLRRVASGGAGEVQRGTSGGVSMSTGGLASSARPSQNSVSSPRLSSLAPIHRVGGTSAARKATSPAASTRSGSGDLQVGLRGRLGYGATARKRLLNGASLMVRVGGLGSMSWGLVLTDGDSSQSFSYGNEGIGWQESASVDKLLVIRNNIKYTITNSQVLAEIMDLYLAWAKGDIPESQRNSRVAAIIEDAITHIKADSAK